MVVVRLETVLHGSGIPFLRGPHVSRRLPQYRGHLTVFGMNIDAASMLIANDWSMPDEGSKIY